MEHTSTAVKSGTSTEFGQSQFLTNARLYRAHKAIVNAASKYDNVDDAIVALQEAWEAMTGQADNGAGYTPDRELGFGSDNGQVIAESILGIRTTVTATRKAFADLGKE
jgi:hypothetical protein